jgi:tetraacyldisaccharide 4'-kinase
MHRLERYWSSLNIVAVALWPLGLLYGGLMILRRLAYRWDLLKSQRVGVPVIVVGNITVGGTGKTPLVMRLAEIVRAAGYRPGIVSRGYGGQSPHWPRRVKPDSDPREVGDEPVLLARRCGCPVAVDPDRVAAARTLLNDHACNVILADDGLQHYALARDIEIAVIDGQRGLGNGSCLPAGPLREPPGRLRSVDFVVGNGAVRRGEYMMTLVGEQAVNLVDSYVTCSLAAFRDGMVHAVAAIGDPLRFFNFLKERGLRVLEHPFPDHYFFTAADLDFNDDLPVLMTEKDAVKCRPLAQERFWYVPVQARLDPELERQLLARLARVFGRTPSPLPFSPRERS